MTTPLVPDFIAELFAKEVARIQEDVLRRVCDIYGLDLEEVKEDIGMQPACFGPSRLKVVEKKKAEYGEGLGDKHRCVARVFDAQSKTVHRCKRGKQQGCKFCKVHRDMFNKGGGALPMGTIKDPLPKHVTCGDVKKIY